MERLKRRHCRTLRALMYLVRVVKQIYANKTGAKLAKGDPVRINLC